MKKIAKNVLIAVIIGSLTACLYYCLFTAFFKSFYFNENLERKYTEFNYGDYVLFEGIFRSALYASDEINERKSDFILMFRWKYSQLMDSTLGSLNYKLKNLQEQNMISEFRINDDAIKVDMVVNELVGEEEKRNFGVIKKEIEDICGIRYAFLHHEIMTDTESVVNLYDANGNQVQEISLLPQEKIEELEKKEIEKAQKSYFQREVKLLKQILSRSSNKTPFDFKSEDKIQGDSDNGKGGHIEYIDLSDYSDIIGELNLYDLDNLKYAKLMGMKVNLVILPEKFEFIESTTFDNCEMLEKITIPKSVTSFANPVFSGCKNLKEIVFEGNAPNVSWEKENVFGDVPRDLIIYRPKSAKGWQEICWDKYDVRIMEE